MALVIPTAATTFADATSTEGGARRQYVLAQFRSDASLEWVRELRAVLVTDELKYRGFRDARPRLRDECELWARIENGIGQATIIAIDPRPVEAEVRLAFREERRIPEEGFGEQAILSTCATALIANTPVAYLPHELSKAVRWARYDPIVSLDEFTPDEIQKQIGGGLRQAKIFAARAHAVFDLEGLKSFTATTRDIYSSPLSRVLFAELLSTERAFDTESPATIMVLNNAADAIATAIGSGLPIQGQYSEKPVVREVDSRGIDEIQAADIAAGWAREILETNESKTLGARFERVWVNGVRIK